MDENFIVDFGEVTRVVTEDFNKLNNRPSYAGELMTGDTDIPQVPSSVSELNNDSNYQTGAQVSEAIETETGAREAADTALDGRLTTVEGIAATALQPSSIDKVVMTDINVGANTSTTTFNLDASKQNLLTGVTSSKQVSMPVASSTEAGIMNSATFDAVVNNTANINALANGAVAITGLPSSPTQAQLTTAWENATGETSLMNRAGIYDVTNGKVWTYYTNDTTWHSTTNTTQVTINTFTNSSEGTIKGSTNVGQIFAEADGTGSVNGWDSLNDAVGNNTSDISSLQTAVDGKQDKLIAGANINIAADGKTISATDTTYTAGNAIDITNGEISADIRPADFFTASDSISDCGSNLSLDNTIATKLKSVELKGDTFQQTYSGDNLYDCSDTKSVSTGVTADSDGWITATYNNTGSSAVYLQYFTDLLELTNSTDYALVLEVKSVTGAGGIDVCTSYQGQFATSDNYLFSQLEGGKTYIRTETTKASFDDAIYSLRTVINFASGQSGSITFRISVLADTSVTPEAFIYQPYTGGAPAPNPDYPQDIQVVTGEQTVDVTGKNKINGSYSEISQTARCTAEASGNGFKITSTTSSGAVYVAIPIPNIASLLGQTVTVSYVATGDGIKVKFYYLNTTGSATGSIGSSETVTLPNSLGSNAGIGVAFYTSNNSSATYNDIQLEIGSTATDYQPYQSQSYPISLGSTELCKIGDYQDYIYKSGDDWYVHKDIAKYTFDGAETWSTSPYGTNSWRLANVISFPFDTNELQIISNIFTGIKHIDRNTAGSNVIYSASNVELNIRNTSLTTLSEVQAATNGNYAYYALATPTDTQITDATLVTQLNALAEAKSYNDQTNIIVTAAGGNLPAALCVEAYRKSLNGLLGVIERLGA